MQNKICLLMLTGFLTMQGIASAEQSTADILSKIEAETLILKAREKQLSVQGQIVTKQAEIATKQSEVNQIAKPAMMGDPTVQSLEGMGSVFYATLQMENGTTMDVKAGDVLPNGMTVVSIRNNEVVVSQKKRRIRLASTGTSVSTPGSGPGVGAVRSPFSLPPTLPLSSQKGGVK